MLTVVDSAGVQIAEVKWEVAPFAWRVDSVAEWSIGDGGEAGTTPKLHDIRDAVLLSDGSVLIVEGSTQEILWVDPQADVVHRVGGPGDGPQQFGGISSVFDADDGSYYVVDAARKRIVRLSAEGRWIGDSAFPPAITAVLASHRAPDGTWFVLSSGRLEETGAARNSGGTVVGRVRRPRLVVLHTGIDDPAVDTITTVLGPESAVGAALMGPVALGATALFAGSGEGVWVGDTSQEEVRWWGRGMQQPRWIVRWSHPRSRVVDALVHEALWRQVGELVSAAEVMQMRGIIPVSDWLPAFGALIGSDEGHLWIGSYASYMGEVLELPQRAQEWLILDLERTQAGRVVTPRGLRVLRTGRGYVLGVHRDDLGVESLRLHRVSRL